MMYYGVGLGWWWVVWALIFLFLVISLYGYGWRRDSNRSTNFSGSGYFPVGPYTGVGPSGYHRADERILDEINDRLTLHGEINASEVEVFVASGQVTLRGTVASRREKRLAEEIADSVAGVRDVINELNVGSLKKIHAA